MVKLNKDSKTAKRIMLALLVVAAVYLLARAIYGVATVSTKVSYYAATLYLIDFNFYIGSRTLIGSVLTLLTDHISVGQIFAMNVTFYFATVALFFAAGFSFAKQALKQSNSFMFLLALLFCVCPFSLTQYGNWVGAYDIYICMAAVLCCMATGKDGARWLCPLLCVSAIFTHYAFILAYYPAIFSLQLYAIINGNKKLREAAAAALTFLLSFVSGVYCVFFANRTIKIFSSDELFAYMSERLGMQAGNEEYINSYYFNSEGSVDMLHRLSADIISRDFWLKMLLVLAPTLIVFLALWVTGAVKSGKKIQAIPFVFFILTMALSAALPFFIIETDRWLTAAVLSQFLLLFGCVRTGDSPLNELLKKADKPVLNVATAVLVVYNLAVSFFLTPHFAEFEG